MVNYQQIYRVVLVKKGERFLLREVIKPGPDSPTAESVPVSELFDIIDITGHVRVYSELPRKIVINSYEMYFDIWESMHQSFRVLHIGAAY